MSVLLAISLALCSTGPRHHCVHDGDTFWHEGEKIRIADIDTPELNGQCPSESRLAIAARNRLADLLDAPYRIVLSKLYANIRAAVGTNHQHAIVARSAIDRPRQRFQRRPEFVALA